MYDNTFKFKSDLKYLKCEMSLIFYQWILKNESHTIHKFPIVKLITIYETFIVLIGNLLLVGGH